MLALEPVVFVSADQLADAVGPPVSPVAFAAPVVVQCLVDLAWPLPGD